MRLLNAGGNSAVTHLQFTPDGTGLAVGLRRFLGHFELASGTFSKLVTGPALTCFDYAPDGARLAVGGADGVVGALPPAGVGGPDRAAPVGFDLPVRAVAFAASADPRHRWLAAAGRELHFRNSITDEVFVAFERGDYRDVAFAPDGTRVYVASSDDVIAWTLKPFRGGVVALVDRVRRIAVSPDGELLAASGSQGLTLLTADGRYRWGPRVEREPTDLGFSPDGRFLVVADGGPVVKLYDPATGGPRASMTGGSGR